MHVSSKQKMLAVVVSVVLCQCLTHAGYLSSNVMRKDENVKPYNSADHYWSLTKIEKRKDKIVKDECGKRNARVSDGVTTKNDIELGRVVSLHTKRDYLIMTPLKSRCISDPFYCKQGITIELWLKFRRGEYILSSGGYTKRLVGPGFLLQYNSKIHRLQFLLSTRSRLWSIQFNAKKSTWVHLLFAWERTQGLVVYENGEFLTKDETGDNVRYPSFVNKYRTLAVGDPGIFIKLRSGGRFEIGHLVIWTRRLLPQEIKLKAFMAVVKQDSTSRQCCRKKSNDPCTADGCFYDEARCNNIGQKYPCICSAIKENKTCPNGVRFQRSCHDIANDCSTLARQPNYCDFYVKEMRASCAKSCNFCSPTVALSSNVEDEDSKIIIVAIAVGVTCVLMLLIMIAVVMARMNSKWQGEFVPGNNLSGSITADPNTQEMIAASVDPAARITDVPFKSPKVKKTTKVSRVEHAMTS